MAPRADDLPDRVLDVVAAEIGPRLPRLFNPRSVPAATVAVTESFQVWGLGSDRVRDDGTDDLRELVVDTGRWHHQIAVGGAPELYARSLPGSPPGRTVREVAHSAIAARLDRAISRIDADSDLAGQDLVVRVLVASDYHLHAFWLLDQSGASQVLVVAADEHIDFDPTVLVAGAEFVDRLRRAEPVLGIVEAP